MSRWDTKEDATENANDPFQKQFHKLALQLYGFLTSFSLFFFFVQPFPLPPLPTPRNTHMCVIAGERRVGEVEDSIGGINGDGNK